MSHRPPKEKVREKSDKFVVGIPLARFSYSLFWEWLLPWITQSPGIILIPMESNRVDLNRSRIIQIAKDQQANLIFMDNDCLPNTTLPQIIEMLKEDFEKYDIVIAPVLSQNRNLLVNPAIKHNGKVQEIDEGSFTFAGVSYDIIKNLKPIGYYGVEDGSSFPLYTQYTNQTSEDYFFCRKMKKLGYKVAADPRIMVDHYKAIRMRYVWQDVAAELQAQGIDSS